MKDSIGVLLVNAASVVLAIVAIVLIPIVLLFSIFNKRLREEIKKI